MKYQSRGGRENRYGQAASVLLDDENLSVEELAKRADMNVPTARYCLSAFKGIKEAMIKRGWRKL